jgi:phage terminase small subunit
MKMNCSWYDLYATAMLELDRAALPGKIEAAQASIRRAMGGAAIDRSFGTPPETQAMSDALRNLQALQRVELSPHISTSIASRGQSLAEGQIP